MDFRAPHPLVHPSHGGHPYYYPGLQPASTKAQPASIGKSHRPSSGVLPQGHTPGPGPGGQQNSRSFAAALRNLAKQAGPAPQEEEPRASPKNRAPPPLVRGPSPAKERSTHERRPEEIPSLYTTARPAETSKHNVTATASELLARSGFQPYRPEHHPAHAPPPFALDPSAYSPYHHSLYPPPHLQHAYRIEEQLYLERCGMLRPPLFPGLPQYPLYGLRYSPDMMPPGSLSLMSPVMHERLKLEEEHRLRQAREQAVLREEEERRRVARNSAPTAPVAAPAPASADTAARKPTIAAQLHSERERERERDRTTINCNNNNPNNINANGGTTTSSSHHQRKEDQPSLPHPSPSSSDPSTSLYHSRLSQFPNSATPIGPPPLGSAPICSVSSAPMPSPMSSNLSTLNLGPPPTISSAPIGPPPIPSISSIPSLGPGVIGPQSLNITLPPIISIPSLHLPPVPSSTIHSSQHTATILSTTSTASSSMYHQQPLPSHTQHRTHSSGCTTTVNTLSGSGMMTTHVTHSLPTPGVSPSGNQTTGPGKSPPLSHGSHARSKESPAITTSTPASTVVSASAITTTTSTTQPAFVRPFEDSFRSTTKLHQRSILNNLSQVVSNHQNHQDSMMKPCVSIVPSITNQTTETSTKDSSSKARIDLNHQQPPMQPVPYPPPFHHPHIPVTHVPSLYKPPHFSSPPVHHQHHQSSKLNLPTPNSNGNSEANNGGSLSTKTHHTSESRETSSTLQRNESLPISNSLPEKVAPSANYYLNHVPPGSKVLTSQNNNNLEKESKESLDKLKEKFNVEKENENQNRLQSQNQSQIQNQNQILNQNQNGSNLTPEKAAVPQTLYDPSKEILHEKECKKEIDLNNHNDQNSIMFTLPFQPSFKFSLNDSVQKPIDTAHLMQSIKSEEVLRTCQNVSNVLLQIPKYQEKLLNFSNSELKTAFCITDKCNNLTEISMKYEPAVLNVPDVSKALVKQEDENEKPFLVPESPKELRSSLDLAEKRRKRKREKSNGVTCNSESEEDEAKEVDLWITKGPPAKPQYSEEKLSFLAMFGLTTLSKKNEIELYKVEKRYRLNPDPPEPPLEMEPAVESALPIPKEHPDVLLHSTDFVPKVGFLKNIGLDIMPPSKRDEAEITWQYVLQDRKKRKSMNTVTAYCDRIAKVYSSNPPSAPKPPQRMRLLDKIKVKQIPERPRPLPPLVPNIVSTYYPMLPMPGENGVKQHYKIAEINEDTDDTASDKSDRPKWTGIEDVVHAYTEYQKEKATERKILTAQTSKLVAQTNSLRSEALQMERRWYELVDMRTSLDSERCILNQKIERINALVRTLR